MAYTKIPDLLEQKQYDGQHTYLCINKNKEAFSELVIYFSSDL